MMRLLLVLMLGTILVACGGEADTDTTDDAGAGGATTTPSEATPTAATSTDGGDDSDSGGMAGDTSIRYTGAHSGEMTDSGSCSGGVSGDGLQVFLSSYDESEDVSWMFQVSIAEYDGPGQYDLGDSLVAGGSVTFSDTTITLGNNSGEGDLWGSTRDQGGTVSVNGDGNSGTVNATLIAEGGASELQVTGDWTCTTP